MKTIKHTRTTLLIFLLLPLLAVECYDEPFAPKLPQATESGEGMMAAKVNGVVWIAEGGLIGDNPSAMYGDITGRLIFGGDDRSRSSFFTIICDNVHSTGIYYAWGTSTFQDGTTALFKGSWGVCAAQSFNPAEIKITRLDTIEQIIAGTFEFDGICENGDTVKVRQGRFDVTYSY